MSISEPFIRRPIATSLLALAILLSGIAAYSQLPVAPLPKLDFPTISVGASLPGASPETMASAVATPLERRFGRIAGITEITSTSSLGTTSITLQFALDRDVDSAARDVQAAIAAAGAELPPNLPSRPTYRKVNPADSPIMILSLTSESIPLAQVFDAANTVLAQKIAQVSGVGQVYVGGGQQPAVRVQVEPNAVAGMGLSLEDVRSTIAGATVDQPKGSLIGPLRAQVIAANDQLFGAASFKGLVLRAQNGAAAQLGDVADISDSVENNRVAAWTNGVRSVLVIIRRQPGANIIETNERVRALLPSMVDSIAPGIHMEVALDRTQTIRASVRDVERTLLISVGLVFLVVFAFLGSFRATIIPTAAVPLSIIGTFGVMYLLGYSLDNLSLMALTISTGFVVDDAIVVTENTTRLIESGETPLKAALLGARQIGFTIVSITVSLLAVFIPILLMGGVVGRLFREFAVTLSVAITVSAIISLSLTPMLCSRLLRSSLQAPSALARKLEAGFAHMNAAYARALRWVLRHPFTMQLVTIGAVALTVFLFVKVPKGLFPQQDNGLLVGFSEAPQDVSFTAMRTRQVNANKILEHDPEIAHVVSFVGSGGGISAGNTGMVFADLRPVPPRKISGDKIIQRLRPKLAKLAGINLFLQAAQDIRIGGRSSRTQYQYTLQSADLSQLRIWAPRVLERLRKLPQLKDVATDQQTAGLELDIVVDRDAASRLGLSMQAIDAALYDAFGQRQIATTYTQLNQYRIVLEVKPEFAAGPEALRFIYLKAADGSPVPLSSFTRAEVGSTPLAINHQGQFPSITISFNLGPNTSLGQAVELIHAALREIGLPASVNAAFQGTARAFQSSLSSQPMLILSALFAVYIVLGMLYESYVHPITILSTLPSAGIGALLALMLTGGELNVIALIGMILLIGIVKKNAILMIDFAIELEREQSLSTEQAIYEACLLRLRPILMTTAAALLGGLPLALGTGMGSELRRPLGITIVGGLIFSQLLTLFTTPVIYMTFDRFTKRNRRHTIRPVPIDLGRPSTPPASI